MLLARFAKRYKVIYSRIWNPYQTKWDQWRLKEAPKQVRRSGFPMERIAIDILGEFPKTEYGNHYKYVDDSWPFHKVDRVFPSEKHGSLNCCQNSYRRNDIRFVIPSSMHSDQGRQFESKLFQEMRQLWGIQKKRTAPYPLNLMVW